MLVAPPRFVHNNLRQRNSSPPNGKNLPTIDDRCRCPIFAHLNDLTAPVLLCVIPICHFYWLPFAPSRHRQQPRAQHRPSTTPRSPSRCFVHCSHSCISDPNFAQHGCFRHLQRPWIVKVTTTLDPSSFHRLDSTRLCSLWPVSVLSLPLLSLTAASLPVPPIRFLADSSFYG